MSDGSLNWQTELTDLIPQLRRYALSLTRSADAADDLLQSTLERALAKRHLFKPGTNLTGWIFRICRNLWIDQVRKRKFEAGPMDPEIIESTIESNLAMDGELHMAERALLNSISQAMGALSEDQRSVLLLVGVEGHSYEETSALLDVPIGTIMSRLARARRKLADILYPESSDAVGERK